MTPEYPPLVKVKASPSLIMYGIGDNYEFKWNPELSEDENTRQLDIISAKALFDDAKMSFDLKKAGFDLGIGGLNFADSLFFTDLRISHIRLTAEDLEAHTLQNRLKIPLLESTYPSSAVWAQYPYQELPSGDSLGYRLRTYASNLAYWWNRSSDMEKFKAAVGLLKHDLVDNHTQDFALILGEGTKAGLFQSILMKPLNVRSTYPVIFDFFDVTLPDHFANKATVYIFNVESERPEDAMHDQNQRHKLYTSIKESLMATTSDTTAFVIRLPASHVTAFRKEVFFEELLSRIHIVAIEPDSNHQQMKIVNSEAEQTLIWVGSCTQRNIFDAIEHDAYLVGYANDSKGEHTSLAFWNT